MPRPHAPPLAAVRECNAHAARQPSERRTRAPDSHRGRPSTRTSGGRFRLGVRWHGRCRASSRNHPQRRGHAFELVNVSKAHPTDRDRRHRSDRCKLGRLLPVTRIRRRRHRSGAQCGTEPPQVRRGRLVRARQGRARHGRCFPRSADLHAEHEPGACRSRLRPGERPGATGVQGQALRRDGRGHSAGRDPRVELVRHSDGRHPDRRQASRALRHRPPIQSTPHRSARRSGRRGEDVRGRHRARDVVLRIDRQEADPAAQVPSGPRGQPPPGSALQGDPLSHPAGRAQRGGCGHRSQLRAGASLGRDGPEPAMASGRRRRRHPSLHGASDAAPRGHDEGSPDARRHGGAEADHRRGRGQGDGWPLRRAARPGREPNHSRHSRASSKRRQDDSMKPTNSVKALDQKNGVTARIFFLDLAGSRVLSANPDGSDLKTIVVEGSKGMPDGLIVDTAAGHLYWTNMGNLKANDGFILRSDLDGRNVTTIVPKGATFTPKQLQLETKSKKLYWCDREGMRVMRANLDGSNIETLVDTSQGDPRPGPDATKWCVGIAVDVEGGKFYWTQKGPDNANQGRIFRANVEIPSGQTPANRRDVELVYERLPEPIDLELDLEHRVLYWTDRGDPPRGNTVNRAPIDASSRPGRPEIVLTHLMEGIGLALDVPGDRMFVTDFGGSIYSARLDGSEKRMLLYGQGNLTGIAYTNLVRREK